ncbi:MAG: clan AA aspartic protease [Proteobacteria bacterium]|nr:clan AA aspartic protease [Pseudomonadota bacterium]
MGRCGFPTVLGTAVVTVLALLGLPARAQPSDVIQTIAHWNASNATCRKATTPALEAIGACEQRDRFSKLLAQMNQCYGPSANGAPGWSPCDAARAAQDSALARTTAAFQRRGGVFVLPALLNGSTESYFVVDSGASHVQIPQELADELTRKGSLGPGDSLGDHAFVVADGRKLVQRTIRLRSIRIGSRTMDNVLASVGAPYSQALLGQSLLRRLNWWKIDNVRNAIELEFTAPD